MKKILLAIPVVITLFASGGCIRDSVCKDITVQSEQATIVSFAAANGISATAHSSGLYYEITAPGSGPTPVSGSQVSIKYTGKLLNGTLFDDQSANPVVYALNGMIQGFQIGLKLIQKGGKIKLIVPSSLAYGCNGYGSVPGNSILYFEVELIDVL
ncbi:MAG TPA: FKBP-type peptidyl-prolyl cis-trans isomerase [Chitinophagaceae bacterium]|nr:FKBP-type peptidyl-prolyl cis-trans isomerase [Chitinophagaceae bacterium]